MSAVEIHTILKIIAESIPGNVAILKPDGDICCVNQSWIDFAKANGLKQEIAWQKYNYFNICKKARNEGNELSGNILQGLKNLLENIETQIHFEYPCHSPLKKQWFELRAKLIQLKKRTFICVIHNDISKRIKAETKLHDSQIMFQMISENAPYGVGLSLGNTSHYANAKLLEYLEYDNFQDYINTPLLDTVHPEDRHIIGEKLRLIQEKKAHYPINAKVRFITLKGKTRFFSVDVYEVEIDSKPYNLVLVLDETDQLALERSEKQLVIDAMYLNRKQEFLESFTQFIESIKDKYEFSDDDLSQFNQVKQQFKFHASDWNLMKTHFRLIHKDFFETLSNQFPSLTQHDLNFCAMLKLNFTTKEIARYLNIKVSSVKRQKVRLKKKLELGEEDRLISFVQSI
jgi:PAS domain-containing protein/DNA-binding CsgD family transcriptional regulator